MSKDVVYYGPAFLESLQREVENENIAQSYDMGGCAMTEKTIMTVCACSDPWCRVNGCRIGNAQRYGQQINYGPAYVVPNLHADCLAEVERLREEVHTMRRWAEEAAHAENLNALDAQKERASVLALLDRELEIAEAHDLLMGTLRVRQMRDIIERGEHRRGEEK